MGRNGSYKGLGIYFFILMIYPQLQADEPVTKTWQSQMRDLSQALSDIVPDLFSVSSMRNKQEFKNKTQKIYSISLSIDQGAGHGVKTPDGDLTLPYIAQLFREDIERAYRSVEAGQIEYAKNILRSSVSYCIACHTRSQMGPQFPLLQSFSEPLKGASWVERISFQAASRQFDTVYQEVMGQLRDGHTLTATPMELEKGIRIALAIGVRVKQSPQQALLLARSVSESKLTSAAMKKDADLWIADLKAWGSEKKSVYKSDIDYISTARKLIGNKTGDEDPVWTAGSEIKYLRASLLMHDLLGAYPKSPFTAEALYLIGLSYDVLHDFGIWSLHEMYYQACVEKKPHSQLARRCYARYKDSIILGYSGSAGTNIPSSMQIHLSRLESLANPPSSSKK